MEKSVLFTSNCFGEDRSAALIARELAFLLKNNERSYRVVGASLISEGKDYISRGIEVISSSYVPPSGGFPTHSVRGFLADLFSGSIGSVFRFIKNLQKYRDSVSLSVVVGDVALLFLTRQALPHVPTVFLSLPKSNYIQPHYAIEEWYILRHTEAFLTRDAYTASCLQKKGIAALFLGNPIMDELEPTSVLDLSSEKPVLALLPGSREEAYENFLMMLPVVEGVYRTSPCHVVTALPTTLTDEKIALLASLQGWEYQRGDSFPLLRKGECTILLTRGVFAEVLHRATVVLGLAGTANEQAAGLGKPVVAFKGSGPQTTARRFREQHRLLGDALTFCPDYPEGVVKEIVFLFNHEEERLRRGAIGKEHMGEAGGARSIATYLFQHFLA
ncbi:lipid-A-disaccharide synthase-related protein [Thermospira aquatica]|uniref:Lipid-A-disaccharide synthase-related protein n=1 Tax=Thermospira aquatica TaxID=2828656 RepID=A0AAX3BEA7_9SPIR|nr:lipid-A-disaccharide synthase-related protein [Thermospira aquatica]URA10389.1 lipid-A-disaccharide synthase-related protein [Thermospira aquatica]